MPSSLEVDFAGQRLVLDAALGLYWSARRMLVVSDLHLEKASFLTQFGSPLAPYDTLDTLNRLEALVSKYRPQSLVMLGDSFHDRHAWERLETTARQQFKAICGAVDTCHLVEGNHDIGLLSESGLTFTDSVTLDGLTFRHEPDSHAAPQIIGHFHPKLRTSLQGHRLTGKCFAINQNLLIMPAFGSFTGGLDMRDPVFAELGADDPLRPYIIHGRTIAALDLPS
ncbi:ligase-associated DNA damage response endonuclease PdeM [Asticcacaulis sp.]|uniref:ligase-associated DNA damage response endonuclease PdeM n=1 Tax=Asticcacaulis sp. TaxID=1872648 RepID=UPI003F7CCB05